MCLTDDCVDNTVDMIGTLDLNLQSANVTKVTQCLWDTDRELVMIEGYLELLEATEVAFVVYEQVDDSFTKVFEKRETFPAGEGFVSSGLLAEPIQLLAGNWYGIGVAWQQNAVMYYEGANGDENMPISFSYGSCTSTKTIEQYPPPDTQDGDGSAAVYRHRWTTID